MLARQRVWWKLVKSHKLDEILSIVTALKRDLDNIRQELDCTGRLAQAEVRISSNEDEIEILCAKVSTMESKQKSLEDKVMDLELRSRRNNIRLVILVGGMEGQDPCPFLEK